MHIIHHLKKEDSGLARATLELAITKKGWGTLFVVSNHRMTGRDK